MQIFQHTILKELNRQPIENVTEKAFQGVEWIRSVLMATQSSNALVAVGSVMSSLSKEPTHISS